MSILEREIAGFPFAVVDVETTGLSPRHDRVVELAIVVVRPGAEPQLVFESLVNPGRPMANTEIHGLTDADVAHAPTFGELAPSVAAALSNRVVASHNVYYDAAMLGAELERVEYPPELPCVCTMLLPCSLSADASRMSLRHACARAGVALEREHYAAHDALAAAQLLRIHLKMLRKARISTFADLRTKARKQYKFFETFELRPIPPPRMMATGRRAVPRSGAASARRKTPIAEYLEEVLDAVADLELTEAEVADLEASRSTLGLEPDEVRAVHAKVFFGMLARFVEDARVDIAEVARLRQLHALLGRLGWAPGEEAR
ncbi:MAG: exonuclease domain-containing protein [Sandaracinaceae bacterium]